MAGLLGGDPTQSALDSGGASSIIQGKLEEADHSSANWYFSKNEVERNSPSLAHGIDTKKETYLRKSYCTFLQDLGMRLKVPQVTIATATTFCHRFFHRQSHAKNDRLMIATVCMFLAGKVEETPRQLKDVIIVSYTIRNKKDPTACSRIKQKKLYEDQKELVIYGERLVLKTLGFDLNVHHPYRPLVAAIKRFPVAQQALAQVAWNFVNDGLRTSLCLQFKPHHIAAGAIFLAAKFLKVKLPNDGERLWWQEFDVNPRQLEEVSSQMLELYEQNKVAPVSRSDVNPEEMNQERDDFEQAPPTVNGFHPRPELEPRDAYATGTSSELKQPRQVPDAERRRNYNSERPSSLEGDEYKDGESGSEAAADKSGIKRKSSSEKKWGKAAVEEGELQEHFQRGAVPDKSHERDYGRRESSSAQDYRHHSSDHHSNSYYQSQRTDADRNRGSAHSKDRDWPDREPKKNRHK